MRREVLDDCRWFYVAAVVVGGAAAAAAAVIDAINSHTCFFALKVSDVDYKTSFLPFAAWLFLA